MIYDESTVRAWSTTAPERVSLVPEEVYFVDNRSVLYRLTIPRIHKMVPNLTRPQPSLIVLREVPPPVITHSLDEMLQEAADQFREQLKHIAQMGCVICGEEAVVLQYPPMVSMKLINSELHEDVPMLEIREVVRLLCVDHVNQGYQPENKI